MCDEIIDAGDSVSSNVSYTVPVNGENVAPRNFDDKKRNILK